MLKNITLILIIIFGLVWLFRESLWLRMAPADAPPFINAATVPERNFMRDAYYCTQGLCNADLLDGPWPIFQGDPALFQTRFLTVLQALEPKSRIVPIETNSPHGFRVLTFSPQWRFPDIIDVDLIAVPDTEDQFGASLYARALIGQKDFDANKKRLETLRAAFDVKTN